MRSFNSQFANPHGLLGRLAGTIMSFENRERNRWAISLLNLQQGDRVLEVGFGPGWAIQQMARIAVNGFVAGVDSSETMVQQAGRRNVDAIRRAG